MYYGSVGLSSPNFRPNSTANGASIYNLRSQHNAANKNPKLKLKPDRRVEGEVVDVKYKSVSSNSNDTFKGREEISANLAYRNTVYEQVQKQRQEIEDRKKNESKQKAEANQESKHISDEWEAKIANTEEKNLYRDVDRDLVKKLDQIDKRLANIEDALGLNGGTKNFRPSEHPGVSKMSSNPNAQYVNHVNDYSSMIKGIQELHMLKRDMGNA